MQALDSTLAGKLISDIRQKGTVSRSSEEALKDITVCRAVVEAFPDYADALALKGTRCLYERME